MLERGPYEFRTFTPSDTQAPRMQKQEDLRGDDLKHYEAKIEVMNLMLISIPNDIYNSMDACKTTKAMWQRVERLMRGTVQNKVDRETRFNNEFDQFVAKPGEKLVNASRAKKVEKSHDPLALVAQTGSSSKTTTPYYVTHPSSVVDYDDDYQGDAVQNNSEDTLTSAMILLARAITQHFSNPTNNRLRTSSNTKNQVIVQGDRVNIHSKFFGNDGRNIRRSYVQEKILEGNNVQNDAGNIQRTLRTTSLGTATNVQCYNCSEKGHYARNCLKPRVQDSKYFMEQMLLAKQDEAGESQYHLIHDRDIIRDLEQQRDKLELSVVELKRQTVELQKTQSILKRKMSENKDAYHDTVLDLEAKVKKNVDAVLKIGLRATSIVRRPSNRDSVDPTSIDRIP
ncbi:copia protein [Tanacetum coccineum]